MEVLLRDLRAALVSMRRAPGFAATAVITLALGVGATTAVFSVVHGVLLRPLPYAAPDRLVRLWEEYPGGVSPAGNRWLSRSTYAVWRENARTLDALGGHALIDSQVVLGGEAVKEFGARISPAVLATLGARPALGRFLAEDDDREGAPAVVIVSDRLWRERYGSSAGVLGASLVIDGTAHTIVGVAPRTFEFPDPRVRFWVPYVIPKSPTAPTGAAVFTALARLKPGVTLAQVEAEGTAIARAAPKHRLTEFFFGKGGPVVVHARPLVDDMTAAARPALSIMAVAVALVLLIACANVASLLLSRGVTRQRELAIRAAVGASRGRIVRQLFTESAVFAVAGSALGFGLAWWLVRLLPAVAPPTHAAPGQRRARWLGRGVLVACGRARSLRDGARTRRAQRACRSLRFTAQCRSIVGHGFPQSARRTSARRAARGRSRFCGDPDCGREPPGAQFCAADGGRQRLYGRRRAHRPHRAAP